MQWVSKERRIGTQLGPEILIVTLDDDLPSQEWYIYKLGKYNHVYIWF